MSILPSVISTFLRKANTARRAPAAAKTFRTKEQYRTVRDKLRKEQKIVVKSNPEESPYE